MSQSTHPTAPEVNGVFNGMLAAVLGTGLGLRQTLAAIGFGLRLILRGAGLCGVSSTGLLLTWALIFLTVTLQMSTSLRPMLGTADRRLPAECRFFL